MHILFIVPYPHDEAPSQRFRFEQYFTLLKNNGIEYTVKPFLDMPTWKMLYQPGNYFKKIWGIIKGFGRRKRLMLQLTKYDYVFIHREAAPVGPPIFEWWIAKVAGKEIIYDFDDAIWLPNTSSSNSLVAGLKWHGKVKSICKWVYKVSCGNDYLCDFARQYNDNVVLNPTTIDTERYHSQVKNQETDKVVIGWTGTHSTMRYLDFIIPILKKLEKRYDFEFVVISNSKPEFELQSLRFIPWKKETEVADLLNFNFGIMPLEDDQWAKGKCGFKALQYMALGMPAIVSPVGVNTKIVDDGTNGFICSEPGEWEAAIRNLIEDVELRKEMGLKARQKVEGYYSVASNTSGFLALFAS